MKKEQKMARNSKHNSFHYPNKSPSPYLLDYVGTVIIFLPIFCVVNIRACPAVPNCFVSPEFNFQKP